MSKFVIAMVALGINFYVYHFFATEELVPPRESLTSFPMGFDQWQCAPERMTKEVERNLGVTDYVICTFHHASTKEAVGVYVGYHASQVRKQGGGSGENMIHPPAHCLPGSGWDIIASKQVALDLPGLPSAPGEVNRLIVAKGEDRQLVYYWYQERGRVIADDWRKIVDLFWDRAIRSRTDGALIRFTTPIARNDEEAAERALLDVAGEVVSRLPAYVPN